MVSRFKILLENLGLSASEFAEKIGVQRSSISHILSGRNKPSVDFLEKILNAFPEVSIEWLISGRGDWQKRHLDETALSGIIKPTETHLLPAKEEIDKSPLTTKVEEKKKPAPQESGPVDYIVIVYKDNTFRILKPANDEN